MIGFVNGTRGDVWLLLLVMAACGPTEEVGSACRGFGDRQMIRGAEYRPCAAEIMAALDSVRTHLDGYMAGENTARERAERKFRRLRELLRQTAIERDYRSVEPGTVVVRWPEGATREFNSAVLEGSVMYGAALAQTRVEDVGSGTRGNFEQGVKAHGRARRFFEQMR